MLRLNKYLRELGYNEDSWPFNEIKENIDLKEKNKDYDGRYILDEYDEGFIDAELFSLDSTLAMIIYSYLCYFREHCLVGIPTAFLFDKDGKEKDSDEALNEWKKCLDKMIKAFREYITEENTDPTEYTSAEAWRKAMKRRNKRINFGMRQFVKYFGCLWW